MRSARIACAAARSGVEDSSDITRPVFRTTTWLHGESDSRIEPTAATISPGGGRAGGRGALTAAGRSDERHRHTVLTVGVCGYGERITRAGRSRKGGRGAAQDAGTAPGLITSALAILEVQDLAPGRSHPSSPRAGSGCRISSRLRSPVTGTASALRGRTARTRLLGAAAASSRRSSPQKSSPATNTVGTPNDAERDRLVGCSP